MIYFDVTKTGAAGHRSGLTRVSARLQDELGFAAQGVAWRVRSRRFHPPLPDPLPATDWFLTAELFAEEERPGFTAWLEATPVGRAAIFHDAIPLKHPHITWPQSVARHPAYLKLLARFDRVWAVSEASRAELLGIWRWQGVTRPPPVEVLTLGADFSHVPRRAATPAAGPPRLLCLGILEPRKNQRFLLEVCADLWAGGLSFELHVVGRVNPHFGRPILTRLAELRRRYPAALHFHEAMGDTQLARLLASAHATLFPTIAEGCGLPLLESLWLGVPCLCSDLAVLRENAAGGGCLPIAPNDHAAWGEAIRRIVSDLPFHRQLCHQAATRPLPTWADAARSLSSAFARPRDALSP
jgi:glycosyltransferase involved in cell wall biosynthesis